jgi:hypothetical protein
VKAPTPPPEQKAVGQQLTNLVKQAAEQLGYGPGGKPGGVIIILADEKWPMVAHAGGDSPVMGALIHALDVLMHAVAQSVGSVDLPWRKGEKNNAS